jgi:HK97 family phage major capsid protein
MRKTILELQAERNTAVKAARAIQDKADADGKRALTATEGEQFDGFMAGADALLKQIEEQQAEQKRAERLSSAEASLDKRAERRTNSNPEGDAPATPNVVKFSKRGRGAHTTREITLSGPTASEQYQRAFSLGMRQFLNAQMSQAEMAEFGRLRQELFAMQVDIDTSGGFLVAPQQFLAQIIQAVDDLVFIRQLANVMTLTGATSLGIPTRTADAADSDWTSELATGNVDTALAFGKRELNPHPLAKRVLISNKLLRASAINVEDYVVERLAYKFGITQEKAFMTGDGIQKPLGIFTASANGISTARDVLTGSVNNFTADALITAKHTLKVQYWNDSRWVFNKGAVSKIRQLKDNNNQYLWNPGGFAGRGLIEGNPDILLDRPIVYSEYAPNTFTTGLYVGILGDFDEYWIVDALSLQMQRLVELYAATNQTGLIGRMELDGAPVLEEAFVRLITN